MTVRKPAVHRGASAEARRLWRSVVEFYGLDEHELALLRAAVKTIDLIGDLERAIAKDGPVIDSPQGRKAHPAVVEVRQQRLTLARLLSALRMPQGEDGDHQATARPQRRSGARGVYSIEGGKR